MTPNGDVRAGQVWVAVSEKTARMVVIVDVADSWVVVALVHSSPELATDHDVVIDAPPVSYPLVVQTDLQGCVWRTQLAAHVTTIAWPPAGMRGLPLTSGSFAWTYKVDEGRTLDVLTGDCTATLLAGW